MTELILKSEIDGKKLNSIIVFLNSWGIDVEIRTTATNKKSGVKSLFAESFGMWADRDIDIKQIRQQIRHRRTKSYENGTL